MRVSNEFALADTGAAQNFIPAAFVQEQWLRVIEIQGRLSSMRQLGRAAKIKRGLPGFVNGSRTSALADTGAAQNIVSEAFVQERRLRVKESQGRFRLGNFTFAQSIGTVNLRWAFAEKPKEIIDIVCHVLPQCTYDLILGSKFLTATETFTKHRRRLVDCVFSMFNVFHLSFLDGRGQTLDGKVGGYPVSAILDTGAERNVMNLDYAEAHSLQIHKRRENRGLLQFADGTFQETVGQVNTTWTFASGLTIPVTFEVLKNCSADVILGEDVLWEHDVFNAYAASIQETPYEEEEEDELFDLAPFSYKNSLQQKASDIRRRIPSIFNKRTDMLDFSEDETIDELIVQHDAEERHRRSQWNHQYGFDGINATLAEKEAESQRKRDYHARLEVIASSRPWPGRTAPLISSTATAPENVPVHPTTRSTHPRNFSLPIIPSIPTTPNHAPGYIATENAPATDTGPL
ncbi:hypothetical protein IMSHALPRED_005028 [Imshaugia aleurites]|uniref:Peptidase A2 domain-containing protein n=1 Tax=Imshaugia aleurites TaxID=172621 RepID=A0A8H3FFB7_9LECA|nr:hypothetical protein IMSHALPRED_005028 [Imshaugia aleurites]